MPRHPRTALNGTEAFERPPPTKEEETNESEVEAEAAFEDVGLGDEIKPPPKKKASSRDSGIIATMWSRHPLAVTWFGQHQVIEGFISLDENEARVDKDLSLETLTR